MNKQIISFIAILLGLIGALSAGLAKCFDNYQDTIKEQSKTIADMNDLFIKQSEKQEEKISKLHSDYNERIIELIIKGK